METAEETKFVDWAYNLTTTDVINYVMLTVFVTYIIILVIRTFRNKASA